MATSFGALCTDFYVNQKLALKMDLPTDRETILHLFDRVRKSMPIMDRFHRYEGELALESSRRDPEHRWLALRRTSIRTGHVNPTGMDEAFALHRLILEQAPFHLTISPLDIDFLELLYGFDLDCKADHDEIVYDALYGQSPTAKLLNVSGHSETKVLDVQPVFGLSLSEKGDLQAYFEVRTRSKSRRGQVNNRSRHEPISIFLTLRQYGPFHQLEALPQVLDSLTQHADTLVTNNLIPYLLTPISRQIANSSA